MNVDSKETLERHSIIFALVKDGIIQLEERHELGKWFGLTIIPGGGLEVGETIEEGMMRETKEEYDITPTQYKNLGTIVETDQNLDIHIKHVLLITGWEGTISDPEGRNKHIEVTLQKAKQICSHPVTQRALNIIEKELSRQNS